MRPIRVLLVARQIATVRSGVGTYARGLVTHLPALGAEVTCLTSDAAAPGSRTIVLPPSFGRGAIPEGFFGFARRAGSWLRSATRMAAVEFDVVHFADARESLFVPDRFPVPVVGTVHDDYAIVSPRRIRSLCAA